MHVYEDCTKLHSIDYLTIDEICFINDVFEMNFFMDFNKDGLLMAVYVDELGSS